MRHLKHDQHGNVGLRRQVQTNQVYVPNDPNLQAHLDRSNPLQLVLLGSVEVAAHGEQPLRLSCKTISLLSTIKDDNQHVHRCHVELKHQRTHPPGQTLSVKYALLIPLHTWRLSFGDTAGKLCTHVIGITPILVDVLPVHDPICQQRIALAVS